ncbi:aminoglycoside phosphotransferase family protein [Enterovibrio norvegicus]|uniref:Phosphotransferase n=1 Tax=Enterovibrio norvegicus TaxID=188144 RepID=A0ABV4KYK3_9GAMM|nr:aminoglycoside phosphotransferase family protein [Enterovibrio norvegicus]OEF56655.1 phosphotransferase [Enterovibrio norvegicus]
MEILNGGRDNAIFKQGNHVLRPLNPWSPSVHQLLTFLYNNGFHACPEVIGIEGGQEILRFVEGDTSNYPLAGPIATDTALMSAGALLRDFHDVSAQFLVSESAQHLPWMLTPRPPFEVICHGDYAPYNVALDGEHVVGVFDFDTAHPAPRLWDVAYAVYCWAPFKTNEYDKLGDINTQAKRVALFCDAYGLSAPEKAGLVDAMIERLQALVDFMMGEAEKGNAAFADNIADGHHLSYLDDIAYLNTHREQIEAALK